ncbi:hypothetical protein [Yersinia enterocolitica]|nr:hypothetical protein [Yersinia enterocolitica]AJJ21533.1 hypothetical protein CH49_1764 [Yersinia enterocolitica]HDL6510453.1 hypothetical protein [Yersinia enterocolitica]HDL8280412.1 hypothetical protein [Yersinia enterocolitica]HDL8421241.1 hypothetical protein [Yersinia enterocolitica]
MNIPYLSDEIQRMLQSADRPEFNLMQRYETSSDDRKLIFVCALIGKLIEQDRMLRAEALRTAGIRIKGESE